MNGFLKQSTASQVRTIGPFVDDTDFKTLENALTIANTDVKLKKNGAASANKNSGGATADGAGGLYHLTWDATDTATVGELSVSVKVAGALVYFCTYTVLEEVVYDALFGASAIGYVVDQPVNVTKWAGTANTTGDIAIKTTLAKTTHITGFNDVTTAQVNTECDTALSDVGVTTTVTGRIDAAVSTRATPAQVQTELGTYGALKPTTAGRTLDVSTGGEAGLDWANIGTPTTAQNLSGTTISTSQAVASVSGAVGSVTGNVGGNVNGSVGSVTGAVASVTGGVTVTTNNDKTGYALTSGERTSIATAIWNTLTSALTTVGSIGKLLVDNIDAKISSITGGGGGGDPWNTALPGSYASGTAGNILGNRLDVAVSTRSTYAGTDTAGTTTLLSRIPSALNITTGKVDVNDKTGFALTAAYDAAKTASSQASNDAIAAYVDTEVAAIKTQTDKFVFTGTDVRATLDGETVTASSVTDKTGYALTAAYDAAKTSASQSSVDTLASYVDTEVAAIKSKTDQLVFTTPGKVDASATVTLTSTDFNNIADAILKRDFTLLSGEAAYSLLNAVRMLRNVWSTTGGTLTVKKEDGTTTAWTRVLSVDPTAQPIIGAT